MNNNFLTFDNHKYIYAKKENYKIKFYTHMYYRFSSYHDWYFSTSVLFVFLF